MISRLRLLRRFSYLVTSPSGIVLPFTTRRDLYTLSLPTRRELRGRRRKSIIFLQIQRRREEDGLCTRAMGTEESQFFWPYSSVRIRCSKDVVDTFSEALLCFGASSTSIDEIDSEDPREETFQPIEVTSGLWIVPKSKTPPVQNATNIIINPGMAFGTGEHPTTKLCLCLLHSLINGGEKFLDYGTGSGVLGIAALKMGAELSVGIDVDPQAVASALENIALNDEIETDKIRVYLVSGIGGSNIEQLSAAKFNFDIVIANILLNPLLELADDIVSYGKPGAVIGLSGIISDQIHQIKERFSLYLDNISVTEMDGWACVHGIKRIK